jgi:hypothetical protein
MLEEQGIVSWFSVDRCFIFAYPDLVPYHSVVDDGTFIHSGEFLYLHLFHHSFIPSLDTD